MAPKIVLDDVLRSHQSHAWAMRQIEKLVGTDKMAVLEFACTAVLAIALFDAVCTYAEKYLTTSVAQTGGWRRKKVVKKVVRTVTKRIPLTPVAKKVAKKLSKRSDGNLDKKKVQETVEEVVKRVVEETAEQAASEAAKTVA